MEKLNIVWTNKAIKGLENVLNYLEKEWTTKEIVQLEKNLLERIGKYPKICPPTGKYKNVHKGLVDKNNYIIYRLKPRKKVIEIITFRGTKQKLE